MIGGLLVGALARIDRRLAQRSFGELARLNLRSDFNEWHYGFAKGLKVPPKGIPKLETLKPIGQPRQTWSASSFIFAHSKIINSRWS
jgi:hypothetical protein